MSRRKSTEDPWTAPIYLGLPMAGSVYTLLSSLSPDGSMVYLSDHINYAPRVGGLGGADMWQVPVVAIVDFNGDGIVETDDLLRLMASWGEDDPTTDIGPAPWGDGKVDAADLEVLMSYWGQEVEDGTLMAHWRFDEIEGLIARDSVGNHDGTVIGVPAWQPAGGRTGGAMQLDGATLIAADTVLSPADGSFSVFAWVNGGAPGQVILSQQAGVNWLLCDPAAGALMTELTNGGRSARFLCSSTIITDGAWHRVGFTWDGASRRLYVDDGLVAEAADIGLVACYGGLNIGCGKNAAPGTFWSGLIDDIRIYSRVVDP